MTFTLFSEKISQSDFDFSIYERSPARIFSYWEPCIRVLVEFLIGIEEWLFFYFMLRFPGIEKCSLLIICYDSLELKSKVSHRSVIKVTLRRTYGFTVIDVCIDH